jgi:IMP cyclohydrolase
MKNGSNEHEITEHLYCGRIVCIFMTPRGRVGVGYRVSSRSFPNRRAVLRGDGAEIVPIDPAEVEKNPYIAYRCLRMNDEVALASNGSHTDAIFERMTAGTPPRDAIALGLMAFDFEHDSLKTPRIVAAVSRNSKAGYLGIVRSDGLAVESFDLEPGRVHLVATYVLDRIGSPRQQAAFALEAAGEVVQGLFTSAPFAFFERPVCAAGAVARDHGFDAAVGQADR